MSERRTFLNLSSAFVMNSFSTSLTYLVVKRYAWDLEEKKSQNAKDQKKK